MPHIYLALGSNLGDRLAALQQARAALGAHMAVTKFSPVYETGPRYVTDQPKFLNAALAGTTGLTPLDLLKFVKRLEDELGRKPGLRNGPRAIDIDILYYDDLTRDTPELTIPHPRLHERRFVLQPLADIAGDFTDPARRQTVRELLAELNDEDDVAIFAKDW